MSAHAVEEGAADDDLAADAGPEGAHRLRVLGDVGETGLREVAGEAAQVDRLADDADADQVGTRRLQRFLDRVGVAARQVAEGEDGDPLAVELVADHHRIDALGELVRAAQFAADLIGAVAGVLEVAGEAALEVLAGVVEGVAAELGTDQDPDREREEDGDEGDRVIARAVAHWTGSLVAMQGGMPL
jgi:hypothetical protein